MTDLVEIRAEVIRVNARGFEDHVDGDTVRLDQSVIRIIEPAEVAGRTFSIVLDQGPEIDLLRREGAVAFVMVREDLDLDVLFSGALTDLHDPGRDRS